jgi:endoglucanase
VARDPEDREASRKRRFFRTRARIFRADAVERRLQFAAVMRFTFGLFSCFALGCSLVAPDAGHTDSAAGMADCPKGSGATNPGSTTTNDGGVVTPDGSTPAAGAAGFLHTSGAKILDSHGNTVRLTGVSWFGLETGNFAPHGLWSRKLGDMLDQIKSVGFNVIRVPFSNQLFDASSTPNGVDPTLNPDLKGASGLDILDKLVAGAKARGLRILLDRHRPTSGGQTPLWYSGDISEQRWIDDWKMLAKRYASEPTVIGADLHNEPHANATWGDGNMSTDWRLAAQRAGDAILGVNPDWLIIVEGIEAYANNYYWWGGNLRGAGAAPVTLASSGHVVYSPHDYPSSIYNQSWFMAPNYPANLASVWGDTWGYLATGGTAPILIGEFGTRLSTPSDKQWLGALVSYIQANGLSFTFWSWNPDSGDTGGILADDWMTVNAEKVAAIKPALAPMLP